MKSHIWKKRIKLSLLIAGLGVAGSISFVSAEEFIEEETREIVVSATRTEMEVKDSPVTVTVINREQIEERKADNLIDALRDVAGVYVKPVGSMAMDDPIRIRGSKSNHVLILIDGKRVNGEASSANARELERIRLDNVERIEILRGPASALYGSDAIGGVINVITRNPNKTQLEIYADYKILESEGDSGNNLGMYFQSGKRGSFAWAFGAGRNYTNALSITPGTTEYIYGEEIPLNFKGVWDVNKDQTIQLDLGYLKENLHSRAETSRTKYDNERYDYSLDWSGKKNKWDWQARFYGSRYEKNYDSYSKATGLKNGEDQATNKTNTFEGRISNAINDKNLLTGGFEFSKQSLDGTRILDGGQDRSKVAFYLQDEWMPSEKWLIIPSVRVEKVEDFSASVTPRLGATYFIRPDMRFKMNVSSGYRTPSLAEQYNDWIMASMGPITIRQVGNPDLDPEKSVAGEIGFEKDWKNHDAQIRIYRNNVKDLIEGEMTRLTPMRWVASYKNIDDAILQGIELTTSHKLSTEVKLRLGYSYLDAYDDNTDERLMGRARHQFTLGATYQPTKSPWSFNVDANYMADYIYDDGTTDGENKSFLIANAMINRKFGKNQSGTAYIGIQNLFDKEDYDMYYYGRTYVMGVNYKF